MPNFVQVGDLWLNTQQIRGVRFETRDDGTLKCKVEFDPQHSLVLEGDEAKALRGFLEYYMTTHPTKTYMPA
jgi:hypothetical protein